jgi:predicted metal-binding membrane protein
MNAPNPAPRVDPAARPVDPPLFRWALACIVAAWGFLAWLVLDMDGAFAHLTMPGTSRWSAANVLAILLMWCVMMAAMMLPSALPVIRAFHRLSARHGQPARAAAFTLGYLSTWAVFSAAATLGQWGVQSAGWVDAMIVSRSAPLTAALLTIAGLYQFSALKQSCLVWCRSPLGLLLGHWRAGVRGALAMGWRYGLLCVGCCWALMALLFVGGVMNLAWIAALSVAVAAEKLGPAAHRLSVLLGVALLAAGLWRWAVLLAR